jgi:hypothetical protein
MIGKLLDYAIAQLAERTRRQVADAVQGALIDGVRDAFGSLGVSVEVLDSTGANVSGPPQSQPPTLSLPSVQLAPTTAAPKRGRPRKYKNYENDNKPTA